MAAEEQAAARAAAITASGVGWLEGLRGRAGKELSTDEIMALTRGERDA